MKTLALWILMSSVCFSADFSPHVSISSHELNKFTDFSGTIYSETKESYFVLSCAHGIDEFKNPTVKVKVYAKNFAVELPAEVVKFDIMRDLSILKIEKLSFVQVKPIKISKRLLQVAERAVSYGYTDSFQKREMLKSTLDYESFGHKLTHCTGKIESRMSGGALVHSDYIVGVLSTSTKSPVGALYVSQEDILEYTK